MRVELKLERSFSLQDFPSGSSINFRNGKLFLIGDDSNSILVLDSVYNRIDSNKLFDSTEKRIPKPIKADLETSTVITIDGRDHLLILGSASTDNREKIFIIPFLDSNLDIPHFRIINGDVFTSRLLSSDIREVNIEGSTVIDNRLILGNRRNEKSDVNHIAITELDFWERQATANLKIAILQIPAVTIDTPGISELCYVRELDMLLLAFSTERTNNAYDDGAIGNSYIGWIENISQKIQSTTLKVDEIKDLSTIHTEFKSEKIEGLCVESASNKEIILHLVSDNDMGESKLFKLKMSLHR